MGVGQSSTLHRNLQAIFESGTCTGMSDAQLVERFLNQTGSVAHLAFEALVTRHGPMVLRVCKGVLRDPHDAQDACQAVFLILARRVWAIRDRDSLAGWLYRIAVRVSKRQRSRKIRDGMLCAREANRRRRNHQATSTDRGDPGDDFAEIIQEEIGRLESKLREPVLLCYFEGLTHDEAAERLGWPVGTVRSRMARARDCLRHRLSRRGVTGAGSGMLGGWINLDPVNHVDAAAARLIHFVSTPPLPATFVTSTVEAAFQFGVHRPLAVGVGSASIAALSLAKGVLQTMLFEKMTAVALVVVPAGVLALGAGTMYGQATGPQNGPATAPVAKPDSSSAGKVESGDKAAEAVRPAASVVKDRESDADEDMKRWKAILEAAKKLYYDQKIEYGEGRITINRYFAACAALAQAEKALAGSTEELEQAQLRYIARIADSLGHERANLQVGKGTQANVAEAEQQLHKAKLELAQLNGEETDLKEIVQKALERFKNQKAFYDEGRLTVDRLLDASTQLSEAEIAASKDFFEKREAQWRGLRRVEEVLDHARYELKAGRATVADVSEINLRRLHLQRELNRLEKQTPALARLNQASSIHLPPPVAPRANLATLPTADPFEPPPIDPPGRPQAQPGTVRQPNAKLYAEYLATAKRIFESQDHQFRQGDLSVDLYSAACEELSRAEQKVAQSPAERKASLQQLVKRLKETEEHIRSLVNAGVSTQYDLDRVVRQRLEAEIDLGNVGASSPDRSKIFDMNGQERESRPK